MYKILTISLALLLLASCASNDIAAEKVVACGVTMEVTINPNRELTHFKMFEPRCSDKSVTPKLSAAWVKTACVQFTMNKDSTYQQSEAPKPLYFNFFYRPSRPGVLYPNVNSGGSESDPVIYVQSSILESDDGVCDKSLEVRAL